MSALYDFGYRWGYRIGAWFCLKVLRVDIDARAEFMASLARADDDLRSGRTRVLDDALIRSLPEDRPHDHGGPHG